MSIHRKTNTTNKIKSFLGAFFICLTTGLTQSSHAVFEPVGDDTDIFLSNPANTTPPAPNVLIVMDTSANWSTVFQAERDALIGLVAALDTSFNVGLAMYAATESGQGNANPQDGVYIRFGVRPMNATNKAVLTKVAANFDGTTTNTGGDKRNNAQTGTTMFEAYRYFTGGNPYAGWGKAKGDIAGNSGNESVIGATLSGLIGDIGDHALPAGATASSNYISPWSDGDCNGNYIIYISNGPINENQNTTTEMNTELGNAGGNPANIIALNPNGQQGNSMDEWARFLANTDLNGTANDNANGTLNINTYTVEVDPVLTGQGPATTALMQSTATQGNGRYFGVSSGGAGAAIKKALEDIFDEIQSVNSVFASVTLPVSINVRGTNLNQVYVGTFRPDANRSPRWFGNLKAYKLGFDNVQSRLFLADALGNEAESQQTGFINATSPSFWTVNEVPGFWAYRSDDENGGPGRESDYPDGGIVEKGGSAQQLRIDYAGPAPNDHSARNLYTCTASCLPGTPGSLLSDTPFDTSNLEITQVSLGLGTAAVSSMLATVEVDITSLSDTKSVDSLNTASGAGTVAVTSFDVGAINDFAINTITTLEQPLNDVTIDKATVVTIDSLTHPIGGNPSLQPIATAIVNDGHGLVNGQTIKISDADKSEFNGTFTNIVVLNSTTFEYDGSTNNLDAEGTGFAFGATYPDPAPGFTRDVIVSLVSHPYADNDVITLAGIVPAAYNGSYTVTNLGANEFKIKTAAVLPAITFNAGTVAEETTTATVETVVNHPFVDGSYVNITGVLDSAYDGVFQIANVTANKFTYVVGSKLNDSTGGFAQQDADTTITVNALVHGFFTSQVVAITSASPIGFNVPNGVVANNNPGVSFDINTVTNQPPTSSTGSVFLAAADVSTTVTATIPGHGFATSGSFSVIMAGDTGGSGGYNCTATATFVDADTFTYPTCDGSSPTPAIGTLTARLNTSNVTAFATAAGHTLATGDKVNILDAVPSDYNQALVEVTVIDADNFKFSLDSPVKAIGAALGDATGATLEAPGFLVTVRAISHGFTSGNGVTVEGANNPLFNDVWSITKVDDDSFTFLLSNNGVAKQFDTSGPITAKFGIGTPGDRTAIINWIRGQDNFADENLNTDKTDVRASIHSDVLHSRPAVVNYNRHGTNFPDGPDGISGTSDDNTTDDDVYIFYGSNDGVFRALKGGLGSVATAAGEPLPGHEAWGFIPEEFFTDLKRLRNNSPIISADNPKDYFADGSIGVYVNDANNDGKIDPAIDPNDKVWLFITMHRGGRFIYALDVTIPTAPRFMWSKSSLDTGSDSGWGELGQTWSLPSARTITANSGKPVLIFGAGYDPEVDDLDPDTVTAINTTTGEVTTTTGAIPPATTTTVTRKMGRGIFVVDAETGDIVVQIGPPGPTDTGDNEYIEVPGMIYSIPSDIAILPDRNSSVDNRMYVGDTGGNLWRVDMDDADVTKWEVTKIAALSNFSSTNADGNLDQARTFLFPPDVVYGDGQFNGGADFDAILIGSGDRENPFDFVIKNRFYMIKDQGTAPLAIIPPAVTAVPVTQNLTELSLFDATNNCIQNTTLACGASGEGVTVSDVGGPAGIDASDGVAALDTAAGWFITLLPGEKVVGNAVTLNTVTFFNTNEPTSQSNTSCESDLGTARQYKVVYGNATVFEDQNSPANQAHEDRFVEAKGGGYLPSPVPVVVEIDGVIHEGVISGTKVDEPPGTSLGARLRKFWYKEIED